MPYFDLVEVFLVYSFCRFLFIVSKRANESLLIKLIYSNWLEIVNIPIGYKQIYYLFAFLSSNSFNWEVDAFFKFLPELFVHQWK